MRNMTLCTVLCMSAALSANAADTMPPVTQRFAVADVAETPDFQKHVVPLFGRLGCNGRACHGSFQGRGGFRLSLFGYDFKADHEALLDEESPRMVAGKPEESLIVTKPTSDDEHEGGMRYERGSWEHHLIRNWIKGGAKYSGEEEKLLELDVQPKEIVFGEGFESKLTVTAVWASGKREDVTPLCRFQSNDDLVMSIDEDGRLQGGQPGDTHLVVFYDKAVVPVPVMRPVTDLVGDKYPKVAANTPVDQHVLNKLKKLGVAPSETCDDATFVRRVTLDLTGTLPTAKDVVAFLEDKTPNKRAAKVDELLKTKAYAAWWTTKLCDFTGNNDQQLVNLTPQRTQAAQQWYDWIYQRVESNVSYDKLVEGIVLGRSRQPGQSYKEYCEDMCDMYRDGGSFAEQPTMPYYWARREFRNPPERAISFAYSFLGIRIQCAQCHKHPFDQWSKDDFDKFTGFFAYARSANNGGDNDARKQYNEMIEALDLGDKRGNQVRREFPRLIKEGKTVPLPEVYVQQARKASSNAANNRRRRGNTGNQPVSAQLLGGDELTLSDYEDAREPLMDWLRNENDLFAKAFVNRVWANYFNRGIVEPPDDLSLANPPCNQELLDYLAEGFVANKYDMHWLHREILNSDTYQRSWKPNDSNRKDIRNFSHAIPRRLPAEVAYDAIMVATASEANAAEACNVLDRRAIAIPGASARNNGNGNAGYALQVFGRSTRESSCDCDRSMDATLLQTVYLRNDRDMLGMLESRNGWLSEVAKSMGVRFNGAAPSNDGANSAMARRVRQLRTQLQQATKRREKLVKTEGEDSKAVVALDRRIKQAEGQIKSINRRLNPKAETPPEQESKVASQHDAKQMQEVINQLYLRTLSRYPSDTERDRSLTYLADYENPVDGLRGLMWAVVNTKEFIVNH